MPSGLLDAKNISIPDGLGPLVEAGYRSLAARAIEGVAAWQSGMDAGICAIAESKLAKLELPGLRPVPHLFVVTGGTEQERIIGSPLEGIFSSAIKDLSTLAGEGNIAAINPKSFTGLQFALDYCTFQNQPTVNESVRMALAIAVSHYRNAAGGGEFAKQLGIVQKLGGIRIAKTLNSVAYTDDGHLAEITFQVDAHGPVVVNVINSLRLLYRAAKAVLPQQTENPLGISERIAAAASANGIALTASVSGFYSSDENAARGMAALLELVSVHKGVEAIIEGCDEFQSRPRLKEALKLAKVLDTVKTGRVFYNDDKAYSCAIGLAEIVS